MIEGLCSAFVIDEDNYYAGKDNSAEKTEDDAVVRRTVGRGASGADSTFLANIVVRTIVAAVAGLAFKSIVGVARSASVPTTR